MSNRVASVEVAGDSWRIYLDDSNANGRLELWIGADVFEEHDECYPVFSLEDVLMDGIDANIGGPDGSLIDNQFHARLKEVCENILERLNQFDPHYDEWAATIPEHP